MPRPIAGYIGEIAGSDLKLIDYLARENPKMSFVFVGQPYDDVRSFPFSDNVHFIGKRSYAELPAYLQSMDCLCLYYLKDDKFNKYRNPKKLLEYLSTGRPVVSVSIHEMEHFRRWVRIASDYKEFNEHMRAALMGGSSREAEERMAYASSRTWGAIADMAEAHIREAVKSRLSGSRRTGQ
jgi:glycosyltransferase involved in cell wall biosynthesis